VACVRLQRIAHVECLGQVPADLEIQRLGQVMPVQAIGEGAEVNQGRGVAQMQRTLAVGRARRLLQGEKQMPEAALARAVGAEDHRKRRQANGAGVLPCLEVLDMQVRQHGRGTPSVWSASGSPMPETSSWPDISLGSNRLRAFVSA